MKDFERKLKSIQPSSKNHQKYISKLLKSFTFNKKDSIYDLLYEDFDLKTPESIGYLYETINKMCEMETKQGNLDFFLKYISKFSKDFQVVIKLKIFPENEQKIFIPDNKKLIMPKFVILVNCETDEIFQFSAIVQLDIYYAIESLRHYSLFSKAFVYLDDAIIVEKFSRLKFANNSPLVSEKLAAGLNLTEFSVVKNSVNSIISSLGSSHPCKNICRDQLCNCHHPIYKNNLICENCISKFKQSLEDKCCVCGKNENRPKINFGECGHMIHVKCMKNNRLKKCTC